MRRPADRTLTRRSPATTVSDDTHWQLQRKAAYLIGIRPTPGQLLDMPAQIPTTAILHIQVQLIRTLHMMSSHVSDNVLMLQPLEDLNLSVELLLLTLRHGRVRDLFARQHLAGALPSDFADDAEGALADLLEDIVLV